MYRHLLCLCFPLLGYAQAPTTLTVYSGPYERTNSLVCTTLADEVQRGTTITLLEVVKAQQQPVTSQRDGNTLCWILDGDTPAESTREYVLTTTAAAPPTPAPATAADLRDGRVTLTHANRTLLAYQVEPAPVPPGVDPIYSRGGFIHPLLSPGGDTLTRIQPADHYHHYGVWNPWTHAEYDGRALDFWNLVKGQGTVAVDSLSETTQGALLAGLTAHQSYLAFRDSAVTEDPQTLLHERLRLRVIPAQDGSYHLDYQTTQTNPTELPFTVRAYRYQGFGYRARAGWNDANTTLLTSAGHDKSDGNATRARWVDVSGPTEHGTSGVLFMSHPDNYNAPEQIRIWPTGQNGGVENVFVNFNPAQDRDYVLRPGGSYRLRYGMRVYDGRIDSLQAERYWQDFAYPPQVIRQGDMAGTRVLLYTRNGEGFVHDNIPASIAAIEGLGEQYGFEVVASEDPAMFTPERLADFDVLVFSNTNNGVFDTPAQRQALKDYIAGGGGFVGIHSACGTERQWPWFARMLGGKFHRHAKRQDFDVAVLDADHPSTNFLPPTWHIEDDECYYLKQLNPNIHVLLAADLTTVTDEEGKTTYPADTFGDYFPTSWYHTSGGGRQWYTSLGHRIEHYSDPLYLQHILGGIRWAAE
ncbi:hypothetical protein LEM8419_02657 [Neolewinella maritima]|uniref:ThuA-like domain-containing protein n=1 Tax=Neolewinella maritima TaxID=1383882 RepID=A0ABN8FB29_9BACT|nr:ThuA domain-containing protein [Neolewinella maritima]CAH1001751.1 hypothetical protein LEM8419_02657 [Neolewinella maritima]